MFQRRTQYGPADNSSEQHILTVLRFHEVRLSKIEKHLITTNKQLQNLIAVYKSNPKASTNNRNVKSVDHQSFTLLKTMMENLTNQVIASQSFMKEIKDVVSTIKHAPTTTKKEKAKAKSVNDDYYTNHKLLELERNIAKAQLISIGMEPTLERIDEYVERMRRDRKRFLTTEKKAQVEVKSETVEPEQTMSSEEEEEEEVAQDGTNTIVSLDESILVQNIDNLNKVKEEVEEEVLEAMDKIPVVIKPRKRRGRPKKKQ
jgi:hypothetical protein